MPDLLSEFEQLGRRKGPRCGVGRALECLDEADKLRAALAADHIGPTSIHRWLLARGVKVGTNAISRHRRGECACD